MSITKRGLNNRLTTFEKKLESVIDEKLEEKLDEKLTQLKSEFFERIDPILKEVLTAREERPLIINRIEKIEKKLRIQVSL